MADEKVGLYFEYGANKYDIFSVVSGKHHLFPNEIKYAMVISAVDKDGEKIVLDKFLDSMEKNDVLGISSLWALATDGKRYTIFQRLKKLEGKGVILRVTEEPDFSYNKYKIMFKQEQELERQLKAFKFSCNLNSGKGGEFSG